MLVVETYGGHDINDTTNYKSGFTPAQVWGLPNVGINTISRTGNWPILGNIVRGELAITLFVAIVPTTPATIRTLRAQLLRWFDPEDEATNALIITDDGTERPRYVNVICQKCEPFQIKGMASNNGFKVTLIVSGDVRWRATTDVTTVWEITASGQTKVVPNAGEDDSYPVYKLMPTAPKAAGYSYRQWFPIKWRAPNSGYKYPIKAIIDTDALVSAGKMQADGDDLRILSDGTEVGRWLSDINTVTTDIWFNLDFARAPTLLLKTAIAGAGSIDSIEFDDEVEVSLLPDKGIIMIGTEAFVYTGRSLIDASVTGITREAKGTTIGAHAIDDPCYWIQHDVYMMYGNATAVAPSVAYNKFTPSFELDTSTNTSWVYETFGLFNNHYTGAWMPTCSIRLSAGIGAYTKTERTKQPQAEEYTVMGIWKDNASYSGIYFKQSWFLYNPCGIINAAWTNGKKRAKVITDFNCYCRYAIRGESGWRIQYQIPDPAVANTWEAWTIAAGAAWAEADTIELGLLIYDSDVEVGDVTVTLSADDTPVITYGAEQGNYEIDCTLTNNTTGESIYLNFVLDEDTVLEVDTYNNVITWLADDSRQYQAISWSSKRKQWLRLQPGNNTLQFDDVGTDTFTITVVATPRYY